MVLDAMEENKNVSKPFVLMWCHPYCNNSKTLYLLQGTCRINTITYNLTFCKVPFIKNFFYTFYQKNSFTKNLP